MLKLNVKQPPLVALVRWMRGAQHQIKKAGQCLLGCILYTLSLSCFAETDGGKSRANDSLRLQLPFKVEDVIWRTLEASEYYRNLPHQRTIKRSFEIESKMMTVLGQPTSVLHQSFETTPLGDKCSKTKVRIEGGAGIAISTMVSSYACGLIGLGSVAESGPSSTIKELDVKGSLFPMHIGSRLNIFTVSTLGDIEVRKTNNCRVIGKRAAHGLDSKLSGDAWIVRCESSTETKGVKSGIKAVNDSVFLEDLGVFFEQIGQYDPSKKKVVLPTPGIEQEWGRDRVTYRTYDWSVSK